MKLLNFKKWATPVLAAASLSLFSQNASAVAVDLELSLVIDTSGSINSTEFATQQTGYANAFKSGEISNFIQTLGDAGTGGIAVNVIFFSAGVSERIGWTQLSSAADSIAFGNSITALTRTPPVTSATNIAGGMSSSIASFTNSFEGSRLTMDVSGDGFQNTNLAGTSGCGSQAACAALVQTQRDAAAADGIKVNGLVVGGGAALLNYYNTNVKTPDGFVLAASDFTQFESQIFQKIKTEITGVPEPGIMMLLGIGLAGIGFSRRYRRNS